MRPLHSDLLILCDLSSCRPPQWRGGCVAQAPLGNACSVISWIHTLYIYHSCVRYLAICQCNLQIVMLLLCPIHVTCIGLLLCDSSIFSPVKWVFFSTRQVFSCQIKGLMSRMSFTVQILKPLLTLAHQRRICSI